MKKPRKPSRIIKAEYNKKKAPDKNQTTDEGKKAPNTPNVKEVTSENVKNSENFFKSETFKWLYQHLGVLGGLLGLIFLIWADNLSYKEMAIIGLLSTCGFGIYMGGKPTILAIIAMSFFLFGMYMNYFPETKLPKLGELFGSSEKKLDVSKIEDNNKHVKTLIFTGIGYTGGADGKGGIEVACNHVDIVPGQTVKVSGPAETYHLQGYVSVKQFVNHAPGDTCIGMRAPIGEKFMVSIYK